MGLLINMAEDSRAHETWYVWHCPAPHHNRYRATAKPLAFV